MTAEPADMPGLTEADRLSATDDAQDTDSAADGDVVAPRLADGAEHVHRPDYDEFEPTATRPTS